MKYLLNLVFLGMAFFAIQSCSEDILNETQTKLTDTEYFKQNVSFFDARVRSIDETTYVREVYFLNLGNELDRMPGQINFQGVEFLDDGTGNDLVNGDGIYTSVETFNHDDRIQYNEGELTKSVLAKPIVNPEFTQTDLLHEIVDNYDLRQDQVQSRIFEITCDVEFGTNDCNAAQWGFCSNCCVTIYTDTCSITVGF